MSDGETPNIIAVDDDYAVRMAMEFMFKKWPEYNLILAEDPDDALAKLEEREYMMMFSDINMPVMSGLDLLKIVKEKKPTLPVVMLTSETDIQNSITAFRYGAMDYLLKPPTIATVRGAIDKAVEYLEEEAKKSSAGIDMDDFKDMVENFSPEKMGLADSGSKSTEFTKLVNMLQEKLIHPGKIGRIHNLFLLSKSGIVIANLSAKSVEQTDVDILGGMFTAVKDFMEDAVSASTTSSLNDIQFEDFDFVIVFHAGIGQDFSLPYLDPTPEDIPSTYVDRDMLGEPFQGVEHGIILPETENHLLFEEGNTLFDQVSQPCDYQYGLTGVIALMVGFASNLPPLWDLESGESRIGIFGLMDRVVVNEIINIKEHNPYIPGLRSWVGFKQIGIELDRGGVMTLHQE